MKTVVITTTPRTDRQERITAELGKWGIPFEFHFASIGTTWEERGRTNWNAHMDILKANKDQERLMVLEDDCYFTRNPMDIPMPRGDWMQVYLGANITNQTVKSKHPGWSILQGAWGAYCIIYSKEGINWIPSVQVSQHQWFNPCYDDWLRAYFHMKGRSLIYNELVARTYPNYSDVTQMECDYEDAIEKSYKYISR